MGCLGGVEQVNAGACQQDFFQGGLCGLLRVWGLSGFDYVRLIQITSSSYFLRVPCLTTPNAHVVTDFALPIPRSRKIRAISAAEIMMTG